MSSSNSFEQLMLEYINRARMDPQGEFDRFIVSTDPVQAIESKITSALNYFNVDLAVYQQQLAGLSAAAPLAWNSALNNAATTHSQFMIAQDSQSHQLPGEAGLGSRISAAGYDNRNYLAENIFAYTESPAYGHAGFFIDWGNTSTGIQNPAGHRNNMMNQNLTEVGIGVVADSSGSTQVGPYVVTQDFGSRWDYDAQIVGVAYNDSDADNFYSMGEGAGGINVTLTPPSGSSSVTATYGSGGYQIEAASGMNTLTFSGGGLPGSVSVDVLFGSDNVKVDLANGARIEASASATLGNGAFDLTLLGQSSIDGVGNILDNALQGNGSDNYLSGKSGDDSLLGGAGADSLIGGSGSDDVDGGIGADTIRGASGDDSIAGGAGDDFVVGNAGNDTIRPGAEESGNDFVHGGQGDDYIRENVGNDTLLGGTGNDTIYGGDDVDWIYGGDDDDLAYGNDNHDWIAGENGNDIIYGGAGNDFLEGGAGDDGMRAQAGDDTLDGGGGSDSLIGNAGADYLVAGDGDDFLHGGIGNDVLNGGMGADSLVGGSGSDIFDFDFLSDSPAVGASGDIIAGGFDNPGTLAGDQIDVSDIGLFIFLAGDAFSGSAQSELRVDAGENGAVVQGDVNGNGLPDFEIVIQNILAPAITADDFIGLI